MAKVSRNILVERAGAEIMLQVVDMAEQRGLTRDELTAILAEAVFRQTAKRAYKKG